MSRENVEIVRRIWSHWTQGAANGDPAGLKAPFDEGLLAPNSTLTPIRDIPGAGGRTYVGFEGMREFVRAWSEDWAEWRHTVEDLVDAGDDRVVAGIHQSAIGKLSGAPVDLRYGMVFTFEGGQVVDQRLYPTLADALKAVGLSE